MMAYKNFDLNNDDVVIFMNWYRYYLISKGHNQGRIIDIMIDMVGRPDRYDDAYQEFRQKELAGE